MKKHLLFSNNFYHINYGVTHGVYYALFLSTPVYFLVLMLIFLWP